MDRDQALISGLQDVGLCESRPITGSGGIVEREKGRKGLNREVRHRLEHRDLDETTLPRPAALNQRAQYAVRCVDSGDRVGERRTKKPGAAGIDDHAQKSTERLRYGIIARPVRIRTA